VDGEAVDAEALADGVLDLFDVDAIDRAGAGALVAADAGGQVEAVEPAVARLDRDGQLGVLEVLREGLPLVRLHEVPEGQPQPLAHGLDGHVDVAEPVTHGGLAWSGAGPGGAGSSSTPIIGPPRKAARWARGAGALVFTPKALDTRARGQRSATPGSVSRRQHQVRPRLPRGQVWRVAVVRERARGLRTAAGRLLLVEEPAAPARDVDPVARGQ